MITATVSEVRERLPDLLGKVQHGGDFIEITKYGKPVAYVVSAAEWAFLQDCEDLHWGPIAAASYAEYLKDPAAARTIEEIMAEDASQTAAE